MSKELNEHDLNRLHEGDQVIDGMGDRWRKDDCGLWVAQVPSDPIPYILTAADLLTVWSPVKLDPAHDPEGVALVQAIHDRKEASK